MKSFGIFLLFVVASCWVYGSDFAVVKRASLFDDVRLKPLKPFVTNCLYDIEQDLVPTYDVLNGLRVDKTNRIVDQVMKTDQIPRDPEGFVMGYQSVPETPQSQGRKEKLDKPYAAVPKVSEPEIIKDEVIEQISALLMKEGKSFMRIETLRSDRKVMETVEGNTQLKYGRNLELQVPKESVNQERPVFIRGLSLVGETKDMGRAYENHNKVMNENLPSSEATFNRNQSVENLGRVPSVPDAIRGCR